MYEVPTPQRLTPTLGTTASSAQDQRRQTLMFKTEKTACFIPYILKSRFSHFKLVAISFSIGRCVWRFEIFEPSSLIRSGLLCEALTGRPGAGSDRFTLVQTGSDQFPSLSGMILGGQCAGSDWFRPVAQPLWDDTGSTVCWFRLVQTSSPAPLG